MKHDTFCRIAPFVLYMAFVGLDEGLRFLAGQGFITFSPRFLPALYPIKVLFVALLLFMYRKSYAEISFRDLSWSFVTLLSVIAGIGVFAFWIRLDLPFATMGSPGGYDPYIFRDEATRIFMIASRLSGAVLVVPVMEELFWRSFLIRYIISPDFTKIFVGRFTWPSFIITAVLFGLEHNLFLAGILAGIVYNVLLYYTKSLSQCILAHAVTNLVLAIYVLQTGKWYFW